MLLPLLQIHSPWNDSNSAEAYEGKADSDGVLQAAHEVIILILACWCLILRKDFFLQPKYIQTDQNAI